MTKPQDLPLWQKLTEKICCGRHEECEKFAGVQKPDLESDAPTRLVYSDTIQGEHAPTSIQMMDEPNDLQELPEEKLEGGAVYKGQWRSSTIHGKGLLTQADGSWYEGHFVKGRKHGRGLFVDASENRYDGEWVLDQAHGYGKYVHADGTRYDGEWRHDKKSGRGVERWPDGSRYEGDFREGIKEGVGSYWSSNGEALYKGQFRSDKMDGDGTYRFKDGRTYTGQWQLGHISGKGQMEWESGLKYKGNFFEENGSVYIQ